jgi:MoaA/NifB/PqqE/SkfB family radical SAM enzyme/glycosyltransferase involved in cell wall biosynthesis
MNGHSVVFGGFKRWADPIGVWLHSLDRGSPLRIAILTRGDLFPTDHGAAVKIVRTAEALSRLGEPCCVVTDDRDAYLRFVDGEPERVLYPEKLRAAEEWPLVRRAGRLAERVLGRLGYPAEEYFLYRPLLDPAWWMRAIAVGELENIDVFQAEFPGYGVPAWIAARFAGFGGSARTARCSLVQHNVEWDRLAEFGHSVESIRKVEQWVLDRMDDVVAVSVDDKERMVGAGTDPDKITVIPHGVEVDRFIGVLGRTVRQRHEIAQDQPVLFFHGTLHYWPNTEAVRFIVESLLPKLLAIKPGLKVIIAGQNPPAYYSHPSVITPGSVQDIPDYIAAADVCLCPIFSGGGTRMKLLEYMAGSGAIVSTTKGAEGIQYTDGRELLVADDADTMAAAVLDLLDDPERRTQLGRHAARFAAAYDWSAVGEASLRMYQGEGRGQDWNGHFQASIQPVIDAHLPIDRIASKPRTMLLLINRGCNLRCSFCDLWEGTVNMDIQGKLVPLLDEAVAIGTKTLVITGGEPFIHPDLFVAVAEAKARGLSVNITTNGTLIEKRFDELLGSGVDSLSFSIDGMSATHDVIRGQKGAWKRTMAGLKRVHKEAPHISTSIYFVVTRTNVAELTAVHDLACSMGTKFDFWPVNDAPDLYLTTEDEKEQWRVAVAHIANTDLEVAARGPYYESGLEYHGGREGPVRCLGLIDQFGITYEGDLLPCCVWGGEGLKVGNVFETPLRELWGSEAVQQHREGMFGAGCSVGCYNHSLYEFEVATGESFRVEP